jgi:hypothetical protein
VERVCCSLGLLRSDRSGFEIVFAEKLLQSGPSGRALAGLNDAGDSARVTAEIGRTWASAGAASNPAASGARSRTASSAGPTTTISAGNFRLIDRFTAHVRQMVKKHPPIPIRDAGGTFRLNNPDDGTAITEMCRLDSGLLILTEKCIYRVQVADQIDPDRNNPALPHNFQQKLFDHGTSPSCYAGLSCRPK